MPEYRFARPGEEEEILDFINLVFSQKARPHDFEALLPKVYAHPGFSRYHAVAVEDGRVRGTVAMLPVSLRAQNCDFSLNGGYIGSVSVHPRYEHRGYMRALMDLQLQEARLRDYDFVALGGQRQRYGYWGFEKCGVGVSFRVNQANVRHALLPLVKDAKKDDVTFVPLDAAQSANLEFIEKLYEGLPLFCDRSRELLLDTLRTYSAKPYLILNPITNEPIGYLIAFGDDISELVLQGCADRLYDVIRCWMANKKSCSVHLSGFQPDLIRAMQEISESFSFSDSQMLRVLRWDRVLTFSLRLAATLGRPLPENDVTVEIQPVGPITLSAKNGHPRAFFAPHAKPLCTLTEKQAIQSFFSSFSALYPLHPALSGWLLLPFDIPVADQF